VDGSELLADGLAGSGLVTTGAVWNVIVYVGAQPSLAMFTWALAWWKGVPYVVSIQDLAAQAASDAASCENPILRQLMERFEYASYKNASGAVVLCDAFRDALLSKGYDNARIPRDSLAYRHRARTAGRTLAAVSGDARNRAR